MARIRATALSAALAYLVAQADFVACHNPSFLEKYDMLKNAKQGATFLLNSPFSKDEIWAHLPKAVQQQIIDKKLNFYVMDAVKIAEEVGLGQRTGPAARGPGAAVRGLDAPRRRAAPGFR